MTIKNKKLATEGMTKGDELVGQIYDDLHSLLENDQTISSDLETLRDDLQTKINEVNLTIANLSSASSFSFTLPKDGSINFTAPLNVKKISCIADTNFNKNHDGGSNGTNILRIQNVGSVTMSASVTKSGSRGHYWGYEPTKSAASDFNVSISKGTSIFISTKSSGDLSVTSTSVLLVLS